MRQRPIDVNQTTVFVDTQPRPVNCGAVPKRRFQKGVGWPDGGGSEGDQMTEGRAWSLLGVAVMLLLGGVYLVRGNQYAHLHRQIQEAYFMCSNHIATTTFRSPSAFRLPTYLQEWEGPVRDSFAATSWELHVHGLLDKPLPLQPRSWPSKRVLVPPGTSKFNSNSNGKEAVAVAIETTDEGTSAAAAATGREAVHNRLWRPVGPELRRPAAMTLVGRDHLTGVEWRVDLGSVVFTRERTVPAGGEGRCMYDERGVWHDDDTCSVHEYLWGLCVKVARNAATGAFSVDNSTGGGPGCGPEWGWEAGQWRRLDERRHSINGRVYLPMSARNATIVTVRHASDPAIRESDMVRRLAPGVEQQILFHAVGLAMCFLGLVLLLSVAAFAAPTFLRRGRRLLRRRGRGSSGYGEGEEEGAMRRWA
ncbi:hypothetical protein VOLCADRAFT_90623 [Volvox carteri f. nagariensis]|uniref:Uncharacterized protein n=1 Tax=Volvox carteri f. nagariensis TaxID=3068 RepID=D8TUW8_VOLCA|nr:uncharacterized protein VOLCADRAFT_90623 [Volvox carteri f. nagariensis]EFJ48893.1 hypothetical protein VOLCADRAFT_90623 [Volvox carteri f. nagariensis]|eukprot:XP_002950225.1 hypothetical protein VOLCADRAFT_90623 [Volvox carteri f. nagariensis]